MSFSHKLGPHAPCSLTLVPPFLLLKLDIVVNSKCVSRDIIHPCVSSDLSQSIHLRGVYTLTIIICSFCEYCYYSPFTSLFGNLTCYEYQLVQHAVSTVTQVGIPQPTLLMHLFPHQPMCHWTLVGVPGNRHLL